MLFLGRSLADIPHSEILFSFRKVDHHDGSSRWSREDPQTGHIGLYSGSPLDETHQSKKCMQSTGYASLVVTLHNGVWLMGTLFKDPCERNELAKCSQISNERTWECASELANAGRVIPAIWKARIKAKGLTNTRPFAFRKSVEGASHLS